MRSKGKEKAIPKTASQTIYVDRRPRYNPVPAGTYTLRTISTYLIKPNLDGKNKGDRITINLHLLSSIPRLSPTADNEHLATVRKKNRQKVNKQTPESKYTRREHNPLAPIPNPTPNHLNRISNRVLR